MYLIDVILNSWDETVERLCIFEDENADAVVRRLAPALGYDYYEVYWVESLVD